jgi:hypothetical protein
MPSPRRRRFLLPMVLAATLLVAAAPALAHDDRDAEPLAPETRALAVVADLVLARPLGLVATVVGTGLFVAALPFEVLSGDLKTPGRLLVVEPARYTFTRPVGQIDSLY